MKDRATLDHFFGRAKAPENTGTVWVLRAECHERKTLNQPNAEHWLLRFIRHCRLHGYADALEMAQKKLEWSRAKGLGAA